jgi:hypothetical protein
MYALIFVAVTAGSTPALLGNYPTKTACESAVRAIYTARIVGPGVVKTPQLNQVIDTLVQYQRDYQCLPVDPN